jgi:ubiquinone/menaquinone biosynthesis C-methylase UbiE
MNKILFEKYVKSLPKNASVLDAGCGAGNNSRYIQSLRQDLKITCLDIDDSWKNKLPKNVKFVLASVEDLSVFKDNTFDCILCFHVIEHLSHSYKAVSEFKRVLKTGGFVFAESPHWITAITPVGFNFYDDPTHIRPHNVLSFRSLFGGWNIKYVKFETAIFFYLDELYSLNKNSFWFIFRRALKAIGLYKTAIFIISVKK